MATTITPGLGAGIDFVHQASGAPDQAVSA
jgi:hypothetical protein